MLTSETFKQFKGGNLKVQLNGWIYLVDIRGVVEVGRTTITVHLGTTVRVSRDSTQEVAGPSVETYLMLYGKIERPLDDHHATIGTRIVVAWSDHEEKWTFFAPGDQPELT